VVDWRIEQRKSIAKMRILRWMSGVKKEDRPKDGGLIYVYKVKKYVFQLFKSKNLIGHCLK